MLNAREQQEKQPIIHATEDTTRKLQYAIVKIENVKTKVMIDTGSSIDIITKETFLNIQKNNPNLKLKRTTKQLHPFASKPIRILGYFDGTIESRKALTSNKIFVIEETAAINILGIDSSTQLKFVTFSKKEEKKNETNTVQENINLENIITKYKDVFEGHGKLKDFQTKLFVDEQIQPIYQKMHRHPYHLRKQIDEEIKRLEELDIIEKANGPQEWVSNLVPTQKANGKIRLCLDARLINTAIKRETFPIPTLDSVIDDMSGSKIFSKVDMKEAYMQIELEESSRRMTNFHTSTGVYRYKRLCYGINNSFEKFQKAITQKIGVIPNVKFIADDMIIYNKNIKEHIETIEKVFIKLRELNLKLNRNKCLFLQEKIAFFGIELSSDGVNADPKKIEALKNAKPPQNVNELRSFLGLCTYVSRFIERFSEKTTDLRELLKGNQKFIWSEKHDKAFTELKQDLTSEKVLKFYDPNSPVELHTDASEKAIGAVLTQKDENNENRPVAYISRSLSTRECNYSPTEREALALVWSINKLHLYLFGKHFNVYVDHQALKYIFNPRSKLSAKIFRWQIELQRYDFTVFYKRGKEHIADFISRIRSIENESENATNENVELHVNFIAQHAIPKTMSIEQIKTEGTENDSLIQELKEAISYRKMVQRSC